MACCDFNSLYCKMYFVAVYWNGTASTLQVVILEIMDAICFAFVWLMAILKLNALNLLRNSLPTISIDFITKLLQCKNTEKSNLSENKIPGCDFSHLLFFSCSTVPLLIRSWNYRLFIPHFTCIFNEHHIKFAIPTIIRKTFHNEIMLPNDEKITVYGAFLANEMAEEITKYVNFRKFVTGFDKTRLRGTELNWEIWQFQVLIVL